MGSSSTSTPAASQTSAPAAGFSAGVLAGAVVASSIGLSLIAVLAIYLYMQSRNRKHRQKDQTFVLENSDGHGSRKHRLKKSADAEPIVGSSKRTLSRKDPKSSQHQSRKPIPTENTPRTLAFGDVAAESTARSGDAGPLQKFLPQSLADADIHHKVFNVLDNIDIHVTNFYRTSSVSLSAEEAAELSRFDSPYLPQPVATMMEHSKSPKRIVTHCLARLVVSSITMSPGLAHNLLPQEFEIVRRLDEDTKTGKVSQTLAQLWRRLMETLAL